jgi:hypothetical protein
MSDLSIDEPPHPNLPVPASLSSGAARWVARALLRLADQLDAHREKRRDERRRHAGPPVSQLNDHLLRDVGFLPDQIARPDRW